MELELSGIGEQRIQALVLEGGHCSGVSKTALAPVDRNCTDS